MFKREVGKMLEEKLKVYFFRKRKEEYIKVLNDNIIYSIGFGFSTHNEKRTYYINPVVGISYQSMDHIINQLRTDYSESSYELATPIGNLMIPKGYKEWRVAKDEDVDKSTDIIINNIVKYAFPFFEKMSQIDNFVDAFIHHRFASTWHRDDFIIPIYYYLKDKKENGGIFVKNALKRRSEIDNKYYIESYSVFAENYLKLINLNSSECEK